MAAVPEPMAPADPPTQPTAPALPPTQPLPASTPTPAAPPAAVTTVRVPQEWVDASIGQFDHKWLRGFVNISDDLQTFAKNEPGKRRPELLLSKLPADERQKFAILKHNLLPIDSGAFLRDYKTLEKIQETMRREKAGVLSTHEAFLEKAKQQAPDLAMQAIYEEAEDDMVSRNTKITEAEDPNTSHRQIVLKNNDEDVSQLKLPSHWEERAEQIKEIDQNERAKAARDHPNKCTQALKSNKSLALCTEAKGLVLEDRTWTHNRAKAAEVEKGINNNFARRKEDVARLSSKIETCKIEKSVTDEDNYKLEEELCSLLDRVDGVTKKLHVGKAKAGLIGEQLDRYQQEMNVPKQDEEHVQREKEKALALCAELSKEALRSGEEVVQCRRATWNRFAELHAKPLTLAARAEGSCQGWLENSQQHSNFKKNAASRQLEEYRAKREEATRRNAKRDAQSYSGRIEACEESLNEEQAVGDKIASLRAALEDALKDFHYVTDSGNIRPRLDKVRTDALSSVAGKHFEAAVWKMEQEIPAEPAQVDPAAAAGQIVATEGNQDANQQMADVLRNFATLQAQNAALVEVVKDSLGKIDEVRKAQELSQKEVEALREALRQQTDGSMISGSWSLCEGVLGAPASSSEAPAGAPETATSAPSSSSSSPSPSPGAPLPQ
mmetsp:Transcript_57345/g.125602  ORF Transcript_57345/g.125602 Transcript_57345/m.125602 type:complete len:667 (-) Transcript_57345:129-2129(-)